MNYYYILMVIPTINFKILYNAVSISYHLDMQINSEHYVDSARPPGNSDGQKH